MRALVPAAQPVSSTVWVGGYYSTSLLQRRSQVCSASQSDESAAAGAHENRSIQTKAAAPPPARSSSGAALSDEQTSSGQQSEGWYWWQRPAGPQTAPLRRRGMEAGSSGAWLDAERLTRDPQQLAVGQRTTEGATLSLPGDGTTPLASWAAAAVTAVGGSLALMGLVPYYGMDSDAVAAGEWWRLWAASLQPFSWLNMAATTAALLTAGTYAERRLGSLLYAVTFGTAGAVSSILWYGAALLFGSTQHDGGGAGLLGVGSALTVYLVANWSTLDMQQRAQCAGAALGSAAVLLTELDWTGREAAFSAAAGVLLALLAGPRLEVLRELDIKEGSMEISGDEEELTVVVDQVTAVRRWLACGVVLLAVSAAGAAVDSAVFLDQGLRLAAFLEAHAADPEVQQLLYQLEPEAFPSA